MHLVKRAEHSSKYLTFRDVSCESHGVEVSERAQHGHEN